MTLEMEPPTIAINELTLVAPLKKKLESPTSLFEQEPFQQHDDTAPVKPVAADAATEPQSSNNNANVDKENMRTMPPAEIVKACDLLEQELEELSQLAGGVVEATPTTPGDTVRDNALKPLTQLLPESSTLGETLSDETSALDALMYRLSMESSSSSMERGDANEREYSNERECSEERRDCSDDRAQSDEYIPFDEMRDDVQDAISSVDPAFLQQTTTRVHVTYNVVAPEPDHTIMFLTTSTESWDCHVARETSLFDDDDASSVDSSCWQDEGGIYYDATVEDDESSYDGSGGSSSTASSSMLGSGGTEYSKPDPPFDPIGTIQSVFLEWADCVAGLAKK